MTPSRKPNILFLLTDDQQFDAVAALGNDLAADPARAGDLARLEKLLYELRDQYSDPIVPGGFWERKGRRRWE